MTYSQMITEAGYFVVAPLLLGLIGVCIYLAVQYFYLGKSLNSIIKHKDKKDG